MGRSVLKVKGYSPEEIKALIKKDERYTIGLRLYVVYQLAKGQQAENLRSCTRPASSRLPTGCTVFNKKGLTG